MTPAHSTILRRIWSSNILLRIWLLYNIYKISEGLVILLHDSSVLNLELFRTFFILHQDLTRSFHNKVYLPLSPILHAILWGIVAKPLKHATQNAALTYFERFVEYAVAGAVLGIFRYWLRTGCYCATSTRHNEVWREASYCTPRDSVSVFVFERPCIEAVCGVALSVVLMMASRWRWAWDFELLDEVSRDDDKSSITGAEEESGIMKGISKSEVRIEGGLKA